MTLGKYGLFAECRGRDIRQTCIICRVSGLGHSANKVMFAKCRCRYTLGKHAVTVFASSRYFFCRALVSALGNVFAECPIKNTRQINFCRHFVRRVLFAEYNTRESLCRVIFELHRVPWTHGKDSVFDSEWQRGPRGHESFVFLYL